MPEPVPTVATDVLLLLQLPPVTVLVSATAVPAHMVETPLMLAGVVFTVSIEVVLHPVAIVYVITDVPAIPAATRPVDAPIVATVVLPDAHVPPVVAEERAAAPPTQRPRDPLIAAGCGFTLITVVV